MINYQESRQICTEWHSGQWSPFYSFGSSGKFVPELKSEYIGECDDNIKSLENKAYFTDAEKEEELPRLIELKEFFEKFDQKVEDSKFTHGQLEEFLLHYMICGLWATNDNSDESGGNPLDDKYTIEDIHPDSVKKMRKICKEFLKKAYSLLEKVEHIYSLEYAGHDFWLTSGRHGAGYWDRDELEIDGIGEDLSEIARDIECPDLYIGDDGRIYA
jgi:hypothetical protein